MSVVLALLVRLNDLCELHEPGANLTTHGARRLANVLLDFFAVDPLAAGMTALVADFEFDAHRWCTRLTIWREAPVCRAFEAK